MFTISNDELNNCPPIENIVLCRDCGEYHNVKYGDKVLSDGSKVKSDLLAYIKCPTTEKCYLVGIQGKKI